MSAFNPLLHRYSLNLSANTFNVVSGKILSFGKEFKKKVFFDNMFVRTKSVTKKQMNKCMAEI